MPTSAAQRDIPPDIVSERGDDVPDGMEDGVAFLIDKPKGHTSFDVVKAVRSSTGIDKVGHAGTLDPLATGLLIVLVARPATRLQEAFMHFPKEYTGTMRLGERTPSHDAETEVQEEADASDLTSEEIEDVQGQFLGTIEQVPPMYSAVKVDGERLYKKARRGETVARPPRQVQIRAFTLVEWRPPDLDFRVECSKGTYIRSLARDLGNELGVGAHLGALRRTRIGPYSVDRAWSVETLSDTLSNT